MKRLIGTAAAAAAIMFASAGWASAATITVPFTTGIDMPGDPYTTFVPISDATGPFGSAVRPNRWIVADIFWDSGLMLAGGFSLNWMASVSFVDEQHGGYYTETYHYVQNCGLYDGCVKILGSGHAQARFKTPEDYFFSPPCKPSNPYSCEGFRSSFLFSEFGGAFTSPSTKPVSGYLQMAVTPVPEPVTWAMLILGFGLTGSAVRRRRSFSPA